MIQIRRIYNNKSAVISNYSEATLAKRVNEVGALQITLPMDEPIAGIGYNLIDSLVYSVDFTEYANSIYIGGSGSRLNRVVEPVTVFSRLNNWSSCNDMAVVMNLIASAPKMVTRFL